MSEPRNPSEASRPIVRDYQIVVVMALLLLVVALVSLDLGWWSMMVLVFGGGTFLVRWAAGPPMVLLALTLLLGLRSFFLGRAGVPEEDTGGLIAMALAAITLVYVVAYSRFLSLVKHTVPPDERRRKEITTERLARRWLFSRRTARRAGSEEGTGEILTLVVTALLLAVVASLLWLRLAVEPEPTMLDLPLPIWRGIIAIWVISLGLLGVHVFHVYLTRALASEEESRLYLQDQFWTATRGEQRRANRWLVAGRLARHQQEQEG